MKELIAMNAVDLVPRLQAEEVSPQDLLDALEARIYAVDGIVNALPTRCFERARARADELLKRPATERGPLCGMPVAIKDLSDVEGVRCTSGSRVFAERIAEQSDLVVKHLEAAGGIVYAKSNTPEFGAGGNTFNDVFGATVNPRDTRLSVGGSSGGAAAALATGTAWLAQGSDLAGSLRTPASFCGVCSLRPSPGRIPDGPQAAPFDVLAVDGPMARCVADVGLMADAMTGVHPAAGICSPPGESLAVAARTPRRPVRIAFSVDLDVTRVDDTIASALDVLVDTLSADGIGVDDAHPDFEGAHEAFDVLRALDYATGKGELSEVERAMVKPEVTWNIDRGLALTGAEIAAARRTQGRLYHAAAAFMADYDVLICPATSVMPYPVGERYPGHSRGVPIPEYYRWLAIAYAVTLVALPVVTIPVGFAANGLPIGMQLVGRPHGDAALLSVARYVEALLGLEIRPVDTTGTRRRR
jgi:amidase